jgi:hypothetical protein
LEEQNYLLSQSAESIEERHSQDYLSDEQSRELTGQYLKLVSFYDLKKTPALVQLLCPFALNTKTKAELSEICRNIVGSKEWNWELSDRQKFLIGIANKGEVPPANIQRLFALMIASREARGFGIEDDYTKVLEMYMDRHRFTEPSAAEFSKSSIDLSFSLHDQVVEERLVGEMAWYFMTFFKVLHPAANISSYLRRMLIEKNNLTIGTKEFYEVARGEEVDTLLEFVIKSRSGFSFESIMRDLPPAHSASTEDSSQDDDLSNVDPLILMAVEKAISLRKCKRDRVDIKKCRFNYVSEGQVVIVGKDGKRIASLTPG